VEEVSLSAIYNKPWKCSNLRPKYEAKLHPSTSSSRIALNTSASNPRPCRPIEPDVFYDVVDSYDVCCDIILL
jgi:hypothetical protein